MDRPPSSASKVSEELDRGPELDRDESPSPRGNLSYLAIFLDA